MFTLHVYEVLLVTLVYIAILWDWVKLLLIIIVYTTGLIMGLLDMVELLCYIHTW